MVPQHQRRGKLQEARILLLRYELLRTVIIDSKSRASVVENRLVNRLNVSSLAEQIYLNEIGCLRWTNRSSYQPLLFVTGTIP